MIPPEVDDACWLAVAGWVIMCAGGALGSGAHGAGLLAALPALVLFALRGPLWAWWSRR